MKQLALGVLMYAQDYDERVNLQYHHAGDASRWTLLEPGGRSVWYVYIEPYLNNREILECPSQTRDYFRVQDSSGNSTVSDPVLGYGWNYNLCYIQPVKLARIEEPASIVMLCEQGGRLPYGRWFNESDAGNKNYVWRYDRHNDGANYTFCDGHAKWVSGERVPHDAYEPPYASKDFRFDPDWD
jgi:prepilin-type processing-associated H-X9-DG protein